MRPPPGALDIADDGVTALVDVDVLHRDLLLAFATVPIKSIEQCRVGAGESVCLVQSFPSALEGLLAEHGASIAIHRSVVASQLRSHHAFEFISWFDSD
jgi:hypothetical protein